MDKREHTKSIENNIRMKKWSWDAIIKIITLLIGILSLLVTIFGIAVPFILFRNQIDNENKNQQNAIYAVNRFNCTKARNLINLFNNTSSLSQHLVANYYLIDIYKQNLNFLYEKLGQENFDLVLDVLGLMDTSNNAIKTTQDADMTGRTNPQFLMYYNGTIVKYSKEIETRLIKINTDIGGSVNFCN